MDNQTRLPFEGEPLSLAKLLEALSWSMPEESCASGRWGRYLLEALDRIAKGERLPT